MVKKKNKKVIGIVGIILALALLFFVAGDRFLAITYSGEDIQYAIPHMASYKCEPVGDKYGITISIPESGALISKETVGFHTNGVSNIKVNFVRSWTTARLRYFVCDTNGNNCGSEHILPMTNTEGTYSLSTSSLNFNTESLKVYSEKRGAVYIWNWYYWEGNKISFDGKNFGLTLYSTSRDPAGAKICTTSCSMNCPDIGYREKIILDCGGNIECESKGEVGKDILNFYDTAPYLERWDEINYDLNKQGGATIYDERTNKFCFAGAIYTGAKLKMNNGVTYLYPEENTRKNVICCPGATISSTYSDMVCQPDSTWKVIQDTDKLTCMSDYNCPGQGGTICQDRRLSGYHCENKDTNNVGICKKETGTNVQCCVNGDCASRDQVCDIWTHTCKGGTTLPVCGDGKKDAGEQCDDGNTISGDGCTSICETEVAYCVSHPEDPVCGKGKCESCDAYALDTLTFGLVKSCKPTILQNTVFCMFSFIKLILVPIVFLISLLIGADFFGGFKSISRNKFLIWMFAFLVAILLAFTVYALFLTGVILTILFLIIKFGANFIPGYGAVKKSLRRKR